MEHIYRVCHKKYVQRVGQSSRCYQAGVYRQPFRDPFRTSHQFRTHTQTRRGTYGTRCMQAKKKKRRRRVSRHSATTGGGNLSPIQLVEEIADEFDPLAALNLLRVISGVTQFGHILSALPQCPHTHLCSAGFCLGRDAAVLQAFAQVQRCAPDDPRTALHITSRSASWVVLALTPSPGMPGGDFLGTYYRTAGPLYGCRRTSKKPYRRNCPTYRAPVYYGYIPDLSGIKKLLAGRTNSRAK